jgi:hypothetical protein
MSPFLSIYNYWKQTAICDIEMQIKVKNNHFFAFPACSTAKELVIGDWQLVICYL